MKQRLFFYSWEINPSTLSIASHCKCKWRTTVNWQPFCYSNNFNNCKHIQFFQIYTANHATCSLNIFDVSIFTEFLYIGVKGNWIWSVDIKYYWLYWKCGCGLSTYVFICVLHLNSCHRLLTTSYYTADFPNLSTKFLGNM